MTNITLVGISTEFQGELVSVQIENCNLTDAVIEIHSNIGSSTSFEMKDCCLSGKNKLICYQYRFSFLGNMLVQTSTR